MKDKEEKKDGELLYKGFEMPINLKMMIEMDMCEPDVPILPGLEAIKKLRTSTLYNEAKFTLKKETEAFYKEFESNPLKEMTKEIGNNIFPKTATFILKKDTVLSCLYLLVKTGFHSYEGYKEFLQNTSTIKEEDYHKIEKDDWKNIATPWKQVNLVMNSYYEILDQAPKKWFKPNID